LPSIIAAISLLPFVIPGNVLPFPVFASTGAAYLLICARTDVRHFLVHRMALLWQRTPFR
jgi:hypothetical protein